MTDAVQSLAERDASILRDLAAGSSVRAVAQRHNITEDGVEARLLDPVFLRRLRRERDRMATQLGARVIASAHLCASFLAQTATDPTVALATRVRAAGLMLSEARAWKDAELLERFAELSEEMRSRGL